jgi:hypothetical protein
MTAWIAALNRPLARTGLALMLAFAALLGWRLWLSSHDRAVVAAYEARVTAAARTRGMEAERRADRAEVLDRAADRARAGKMEEEIDNGIQSHPGEARRPIGPASAAALGELRRR